MRSVCQLTVCSARGIGDSGKPLMRYTTSEMARDAVELLDHLGWTQDRSFHVVGISMGGMIAQELVKPPTSHGIAYTQTVKPDR